MAEKMSRPGRKDEHPTPLSRPRCTRRTRNRAATRIQAIYRGEQTRNRVVQPALDAFCQVCERISAECPIGLTAERFCGPMNLPRWLSEGRRAIYCGLGDSSAVLGDDGSVGCATAAAGTPTPSHVGLVPIASDFQPEPNVAAATSAERRDTIESMVHEGTEEEGGNEEEDVESNAGGATQPIDDGDGGGCPCPAGSTQQVTKDSVERDLIGRSDGSGVIPAGNETELLLLQHQQQSTGPNKSNGEAFEIHRAPSSSAERVLARQERGSGGAGGRLPVGRSAVRVEADRPVPLVTESIAAAEMACFTYSDGEDDDFAATQVEGVTKDSVLLMSNHGAPPSPPTLVVEDDTAASPGRRVEGGARHMSSGKPRESRKPSHAAVGERNTPIAASGSRKCGKGNDDDVEAAFGDEHDNNVRVAGSNGEKDWAMKDRRRKRDPSTKATERAASWENPDVTYKPQEGSTGERQSRGRGGIGKGSAELLAHAYAAFSSPTRDSSDPLCRGQSGGEDPGRSLTLSVASSFEASPLKGEFISELWPAATSVPSTRCPGDGARHDHLLVGAKVVVSRDANSADAAGVGVDLPRSLSTRSDQVSRPSYPNSPCESAGRDRPPSSVNIEDIDLRASRNVVQKSHRPQLPSSSSEHNDDLHRRSCHKEKEVDRAASIADWSSLELAEERRRIQRAIESRVRYLRSVMREHGSSAT